MRKVGVEAIPLPLTTSTYSYLFTLWLRLDPRTADFYRDYLRLYRGPRAHCALQHIVSDQVLVIFDPNHDRRFSECTSPRFAATSYCMPISRSIQAFLASIYIYIFTILECGWYIPLLKFDISILRNRPSSRILSGIWRISIRLWLPSAWRTSIRTFSRDLAVVEEIPQPTATSNLTFAQHRYDLLFL